jgi:hypothetical protein
MRRRYFAALLGAVGVWHHSALAQPRGRSERIARVGILSFARQRFAPTRIRQRTCRLKRSCEGHRGSAR